MPNALRELIEVLENIGTPGRYDPDNMRLVVCVRNHELLAQLKQAEADAELRAMVEHDKFFSLTCCGPIHPNGSYRRRALYHRGRLYSATADTSLEALKAAYAAAGIGLDATAPAEPLGELVGNEVEES